MRARARTILMLTAWLGSACTPTPATVTDPEPAAAAKAEAEPKPEPVEIPVLGLELGLPPPPDFVVADVPALHEDQTWSILGLRSVFEQMLPEAESGRVVLVSAYVQEVYEPPACPADEGLCPPGKQAHAWLVDAPDVRGKQMALMVVGTGNPIPEWDEATLRFWAEEPEVVLVPGQRYVFMGWFRLGTDSGFDHDHGLLELLAVTEYPLAPNSRWIFPRNSEHHPKARRERRLAPIDTTLALAPPGIVAGAALPTDGPLVEPEDRHDAQERGRAATRASDPRRADYYYRWLIVDDPSHPLGWTRLADMYVGYGELEAGLEIIDIAIERSPEQAALHTGRGRLLLNSNDLRGAVESYRRALELAPDTADALFGLGIAHAELGEREPAIEWLTKFLELATDAPEHVRKAARDTIMRMEYAN